MATQAEFDQWIHLSRQVLTEACSDIKAAKTRIHLARQSVKMQIHALHEQLLRLNAEHTTLESRRKEIGRELYEARALMFQLNPKTAPPIPRPTEEA